MTHSGKIPLEHAYSRYMCVTEGLIDKLQGDYLAGRDLGESIPGMDENTAATIVAESLEADRNWETLPDRLMRGSVPAAQAEQLSDWTRATMAELLFEVVKVAKSRGDKTQERNWRALAWASLEELLKSPTASPMLWYEDIYYDVGHELRISGEREAIGFFKQALAHNLQHNEGGNADGLLRDLAETYLWLDELEEGLGILAALLRNDPADIWTYNLMAITFDGFGLKEVGAEATRRGLELIEATGDPEGLHEQLLDALERLEKSEQRVVDPAVLAELRAALALGFDAGEGRAIEVLCQERVPDLDRVPVKRRWGKPDLPPPGEWAQRRESPPARQKLGRNDPCWCGSGRKYKHCHWQADRGR